ncbi:MAG: right-handed parallel beta-helix repeat-containing protein [Magnetococcus sp. WYHC-3]
MRGQLLTNPRFLALDGEGQALAGGCIHTLEPGTTIPKTTWMDGALSIPHTNPVVLDAAGQAPAIYYRGGLKIRVTDARDVTVMVQDDLQGNDPAHGVSVEDRGGDLAAAVAALAGGGVLLVDIPVTLESDLVVPRSVALQVVASGFVTVMPGAVLTLLGTLQAPCRPVFQGSVRLPPDGLADKAMPQWFGAWGDGVHDDAPAVESLVMSGVGRMILPPGIYRLGDDSEALTLELPPGLTLDCAPGAVLAPATTTTVLLGGPIEAAPQALFQGTGTWRAHEDNRIEGLDIRWFGAVANDASRGVENSAAIQRALDCAHAAGNVSDSASPQVRVPPVRLPVGLFTVAASVDVPAWTRLLGEGFNSILACATDAPALSVLRLSRQVSPSGNNNDWVSSAQVVLRDFAIHGGKRGSGAPYDTMNPMHGIEVAPLYQPYIYAEFRNLLIKEMSGSGLMVRERGLHNSVVRDCIVRDNWQNGIYLSAARQLEVRDCLVRTTKVGPGVLIEGAGVSDCRVSGGRIAVNRGHGVKLYNGPERVLIDNCAITHNGHYPSADDPVTENSSAVWMDLVRHVRIGDCFLNQNTGHGLFVDRSTWIQMVDNLVSANGWYGIFINSANDCQIKGNMVLANSGQLDATETLAGVGLQDGIGLNSYDGSSRNLVSGNIVRSGAPGERQHRYGIHVATVHCVGNFIHGNDLRNAGNSGSWADAGTGTIWSDNQLV